MSPGIARELLLHVETLSFDSLNSDSPIWKTYTFSCFALSCRSSSGHDKLQKCAENLVKCLVTLSVFLKPNFVVLFDIQFDQVMCSNILLDELIILAYGISWHWEVRIANQITSPNFRDFRMQCFHYKTDMVMKPIICWSCWIEGEVDLCRSIVIMPMQFD